MAGDTPINSYRKKSIMIKQPNPMKSKALRGVFSSRKRLSDGSIRTYWYHRSSGNRLPSEYGSPEFLTAYLDASKLPYRPSETFDLFILEYLFSRKFNNLALRTKAEYRRILTHIEGEFGSLPIKALESPMVRGTFISCPPSAPMGQFGLIA